MNTCEKELTLYEQIENKHGTVHNRRCINGRITGSNNCVGFCEYSEHPGFLTTKLRNQHKCIEKECFYYINKDRTRKANTQNKEKIADCLVDEAGNCIREYEGFKVIRAIPNGQRSWIMKYIAISNDYPIKAIEEQISKKIGYIVRLERLNYDFDVCARLLLAI